MTTCPWFVVWGCRRRSALRGVGAHESDPPGTADSRTRRRGLHQQVDRRQARHFANAPRRGMSSAYSPSWDSPLVLKSRPGSSSRSRARSPDRTEPRPTRRPSPNRMGRSSATSRCATRCNTTAQAKSESNFVATIFGHLCARACTRGCVGLGVAPGSWPARWLGSGR